MENISQTNSTAENSPAENLANIVGLIQTILIKISQTQKGIYENQEIVESALLSDPIYKEQADKVKEIVKEKAEVKKRVLHSPELSELERKLKEMRSEVKDARIALSEYLQEYQRLSGENTIEDLDGEVNTIVFTAKLVKTTDN